MKLNMRNRYVGNIVKIRIFCYTRSNMVSKPREHHLAMSISSSTPSLGQPISEKLTRENFILWKAQIVPIMRGAQLFGFLDGTTVEPMRTDASHGAWVTQDQQVLGFINASLSREVLGHDAICTTAAAVYKEINNMFTSQSRARTIQLWARLTTTRKGDQSAATYYNKMKGFTDEMAMAGTPLEDEDFISYVLAGGSRLQLVCGECGWKNRDFSWWCLLSAFGSQSTS
jgi:hypothetical protein